MFIRFGQISVSKSIKILGFQLFKKEFLKIGISTGKYWCFILFPSLSIKSFDPVGVVVVTSISE